ncbi:MAG: response regulator [Candidatus Omnitrophota bacterium]
MIKILIIDDEKEIREGLKEYVTDEYDCWVDLASNGDGGLRLCQKKQYDIIFTDYLFLSKEDGFTFLSKIKQMEEQKHYRAHIRVYFHSRRCERKERRGRF